MQPLRSMGHSAMTAQNTDIADLLANVDRLVREAFERGYRAGAQATLEKIVRAANVEGSASVATAEAELPVPTAVTVSPSGDYKSGSALPSRLERGTVRRVLKQVMSPTTGVTTKQAEIMAKEIQPDMSATSIPNELRRNEGSLYRRDGNLWFLMGDAETRTAGFASNEHPADHHQLSNGGAVMDPP
jgi:hypothetical protein